MSTPSVWDLINKTKGWYTTALQAVQGTDLTGKTSVVTGGNSGIGVETVRALATAGSRVILTSRSVPAGEKIAKELKACGVKGTIIVKQLDLSDLASIRRFTADFLATEEGPDLLILNAGVMACPLGYTKDGFEMQIGTNHFGHFVLTRDLLPSMRKLGRPARIVAVSSMAHHMGSNLDLDNLHYRKGRKYSAWHAYGESKLANVLFAKELARREAGGNIKAYSLHPGAILTNLGRHQWGSGWGQTLLSIFFFFLWKNPAQGAGTSITAAVSPELEGQSGAYLSDCKITRPSRAGENPLLAKRLWEVTEQQLAEAKL